MSAKNLFRKLMTKAFRTPAPAPVRRAAPKRTTLAVEQIEERVTPANYTLSSSDLIVRLNTGDTPLTVSQPGGPGGNYRFTLGTGTFTRLGGVAATAGVDGNGDNFIEVTQATLNPGSGLTINDSLAVTAGMASENDIVFASGTPDVTDVTISLLEFAGGADDITFDGGGFEGTGVNVKSATGGMIFNGAGLGVKGTGVTIDVAGGITSPGAATLDVMATVLSVIADGGIGAAGAPLILKATSFTTNTSPGNANQYLASNGTSSASGLNAGSGTVSIVGGSINVSSSNVINDATSIDVNGGSFGANGTETITLLRLTTGTVSGSGILTSTAGVDARSGTLGGRLGGTAGVTKTTTGTVIISGNNTYTGATVVSAGTLEVTSATALGTTAAGTTVASGATLDVRANIGTEAVSVGGTGVGANGALVTSAGTGTVGGAVTLTADASIGGAGTLTVGGNIGGAFGVSKVGSGTTTLGGTNGYTGVTFVGAGTLLLTGSLTDGPATFDVNVNTVATFGGTGTTNGGTVFVTTLGRLAPGTSPGIISTGNLALSVGAVYDVELATPYATAGTGYDQTNVTGTVNIGLVTLNLTGGTVAGTAGQVLTIINNDGTDAVVGTFNGLPDGAMVTSGSFVAFISYYGGDGNDVTLTVGGANPVLVGTGVADSFEVRRVGGTTQVLRGGVLVYTAPTAAIATMQVDGAGGNDNLFVNFAGGNPLPTGGTTFNGGAQTGAPGDSISTGGGSFNTITYTFANPNDGSLAFDPDGPGGVAASVLAYTGLEPVTDNNDATNRVLDYTAVVSETITLQDDGNLGNNTSRVTSTQGETTTFTNPTATLTINAAAGAGAAVADTVVVTTLDTGLSGRTITINTGTAGDTVNLSNGTNFAAATAINVNTSGGNDSVNVSVNGANINLSVNTGAGAGDAANVGFTAPGQSFGQGNLEGIAGTVNITDAGDGLTLQVDDFADNDVDGAVTFTATSITGAADAGGSIGYTNVSTLNYNLPNVAGAPGDQVNVQSSAAGTTAFLFGNLGDDAFTVGNASSVVGVLGPVTINGNAGTDTVNYNSQNDPSGTYTVTATTVQRTGTAAVTYGTIETLNVNTSDAAGAGDTVNVTGTAAGVVSTVNANNGTDTVTVTATSATGPLTVNGGAGLDTIVVGSTDTTPTGLGAGSLTPVAGAVVVNGDAGGADLIVDGSAAIVAANYQITSTTVTRITPSPFGGVTYATLSTLRLKTGTGANVIDVPSTAVPTAVLTSAGADTINVGGTTALTLANIAGPVTVDGGTGAGSTTDTDTVNVNDQNSAGSFTYTVGAAVVMRGATTVVANYNVGANTEHLVVNGSTAGTNTYTVTGTSATVSNTVNDGTAAASGNGTFNIQANAVQAGAANTFNGFLGTDTFNVNFAADTSVSAAMGTTFVVNGGDPSVANPLLRDVVNLNTTLDTADRVLGFGFLGGGNATVTGLGTPTFLALNAVETVVYSSNAGGNDLATVTGTAASEVISVTPLAPHAAAVFLGGTPTIVPGLPANNDPGVAGGNAGPDLFLQNLEPGNAFGLTIVGGGGTGDQLVVNAPTENVNAAAQGAAWNAAAFGGPAFATSVVPAGSAFDVINVTEFLGLGYVQISNAFLGGALVNVKYVTASFAGTNAIDVVVNAGEEAIGAATVADDISVLLSTQIGFQINGGAPLPPAGAPLRGDRLNVVTPAELNIYSDAASPPNVTVTSSLNGTPTQPLTSNNIELLVLTSGNGQVNILGDNNNTATQADALVILGQDVDSTLAGGDLFGDNEFLLLIHGNNTVSLLNQAPVAVRNALNLNVFGFNGDDDIVIDPFANSTTPWGVAVNVDAGAGNDDLGYGNIIPNVFADATPDGSQALFNEAVVVEATITPGAGSITTPGAVTISFQGTEDLSFLLNDSTLGDTDTLLIRTPDSAGVPETVTVNPDAAGTDAAPLVDIDATVGVQLLQIENVSLVNQAGAQFFALALSFDLQNGADTFVVTPSANGTAINVNGGAPANAPGDTLDVRFAGTTSPLLSVTAGPPSYTGSWTFANRAAVNFADFETIFPTVTVAATTQAAEPATNGAFTFTRTGDSALALTINYTIAGTATGGADYATLTGTATFAAGSATVVVPVTVTDDTIFEGPETVVVTVAGGSSYVIGAAPANTATVTITDNDAQPTVSIAADVTAAEGATALFTVTLSNPSTQVITVQVATAAGTATPAVDYTSNSQTLTFAPGQTSLTFSVATNDDLLDEADETFTVNLTGPTNATLATATRTGTITDNDAAPSFTIDDVAVDEGAGTATFTITLSAASGQPVTVSYATTAGTAVAPEDYTAIAATPLVFAPGVTSRTVTVTIVNDTIDEPAQVFTVNLSAAVNATIADASGSGTIIDNDNAPTVSVADAAAVTEGGTLSFDVTLSAASQHVITVFAQTADGTAVAPGDYGFGNVLLTFNPGQTAIGVLVSTIDDTVDEADTERMFLNLSNGANVTIADGTGDGFITDNDAPPVVSINDTGATVVEGGTAAFTVSLSTPSALPVTVVVATSSGGTAAAGADYTPNTLAVTFAPGETVRTFNVATLDDLLDEDDETFTVTLSNPTNATLGTTTAPGTITDNDATPTVSVNDVTVNEAAGSMTFTVTLSAASGRTITVDYQTTDGAAVSPADFTAIAAGTLTFAPGVTTQTVTVVIAEDLLDEAAEAFTLDLVSGTNVNPGDISGVGTILDNDNAPTVSVNDVTVSEAAGTATFTVTLSAASGQTITLTAGTAAGSATAGADYTTLSQLLTFAPGVTTQTFTVAILEDAADELDETFFVNLTGPTNVTLNDAQGVGTITDNDAPPTVSISGTPTVAEGITAEFTVSLSAANWQTITVRVSTVQGTAGSGVDYTPVIQTLTFAPGVTSQTVSVPTTNDTIDEVAETFTAVLSNPTNATIAVGTDTATIVDDDAPTAAPDGYTTNEDTLLTVAAPGVLDNDTANATRVAVLVTTTANGVLTLDPNGGFTYSPNLNFSGTDSFRYRVDSGGVNNLSNIVTVTITVRPVADAPTVTATTPVTGDEGAAIPLTLAAALVDADGSESLAVVVTGFPIGTTFSAGFNDNTTLFVTPAQLAGLTMTVPDGTQTFNLQVTATATEAATGATASTSRTVVVTIDNVDPTGTLTNSGPVNEGSTTTVTYTVQADPSQPDVVAGFHYAYDLDNNGTFDIGDGTYAGSVTSATATVPANLLDDGPGTRVVRGRVIDKDGGFTESTTTITINNVAPTATFTAPPANERMPVTVTFANPKDPSQADTLAGFTYSYDLNNDGVFEVGPTASPTATFTPDHDGTYTVRGRITDKNLGTTEYLANGSTGVVVRNVDRYAIGTGVGGAPRVIVYETGTAFTTGGVKLNDFFAYDAEFRGGVQVAVGDVTGDGVPDIVTGTGVGGGPHVQVFDGVNFARIGSFLAYEDTFRGGVQVAVGDVDGDGTAEIITGVGDGGGPVVKVFRPSGALVSSFMAYEASFRGGVNVGAADLDGDGKAEIITGAGNGGGPVVKVFDAATLALRTSFLAYEEKFRGGVNVAGGDLDGDGRAEIVTGSGIGGGPVLKTFSAAGAPELSATAFGPDKIGGQPLRNGIRVAVHDIDGDGDLDVVVGSGPDYTASVSLRRGSDLAELSFFLPYEADNNDRVFTGGIYVG